MVVPMFLSEISPTHLRGAIGTLNQFGVVFGMLIAYILGLHQVSFLANTTKWNKDTTKYAYIVFIFRYWETQLAGLIYCH